MRDDDVDAAGEYLCTHPSAEGFSGTHPSAEGFLASLENRPTASRPAMTAGPGSP
jgi:hypothetical protein